MTPTCQSDTALTATRRSPVSLSMDGAAVPRDHRPGIEVQTVTLPELSMDWRRVGPREWSTGSPRRGVRLCLESSGARIDAWGDTARPAGDCDAPDLRVAVHVALCEAMRAAGFAPLHAAVGARNGEALAFLGHSGIGKS